MRARSGSGLSGAGIGRGMWLSIPIVLVLLLAVVALIIGTGPVGPILLILAVAGIIGRAVSGRGGTAQTRDRDIPDQPAQDSPTHKVTGYANPGQEHMTGT